MEFKKVAIIGHGFVGKAVDFAINYGVEKYVVDPIYNTTLEDLPEDIEVAFVAVPTPMSNTGEINASILSSVVLWLQENRPKCLVVIKSTVVPEILKQFDEAKVVYNPEFLTEKNAKADFTNPVMHVFGGLEPNTYWLQRFYEEHSSCKPCPVFHMSIAEASFVKYGINCFLATKVLFFNQFFDIVDGQGANFNKVMNALTTDPRIGRSHTAVPGFDDRRGYGGACFTKDTNAFAKFANGNFTLLNEAIKKNVEYRSKYELDDREKEQNVSYKP
jgi:nucleotide sugar dehydrogenase